MIGAIATGTPSITTSARSVVNTRKLKVIDYETDSRRSSKKVFFAMGMELSTRYVAKRKGLQGWCRMAVKAITLDKRRGTVAGAKRTCSL